MTVVFKSIALTLTMSNFQHVLSNHAASIATGKSPNEAMQTFAKKLDEATTLFPKGLPQTEDGHDRALQQSFDPTDCVGSTLDNGDPFVFCPNFCGPGLSFAISTNDVIGASCIVENNPCLDPDVFDCTNIAIIAADTDDLFTPEFVCQFFCPVGVVAGGFRRNCFPNSFGNWQCIINAESPLEVSSNQGVSHTIGDESGLLVVCPTLTTGFPDPDACSCTVVLEDPLEFTFTTNDFCQSCDLRNDELSISFDCSNKLVGECVGINPDGSCISNSPVLAPVPAPTRVPVPAPTRAPVPAPILQKPTRVPVPAPVAAPVPFSVPGAPIPGIAEAAEIPTPEPAASRGPPSSASFAGISSLMLSLTVIWMMLIRG